MSQIFIVFTPNSFKMYKTVEEALNGNFFATEPELEKVIRLLIAKPQVNVSGRLTLLVEVDGTKTIEQLIADGKYDWKNSDVNQKNYPVANITKRTTEIELFHFNRSISSDGTKKEMDKAGFRPATIEELLTLGSSNPELQRQFPIIALGSVCRLGFDRFVAFLDVGDGGRKLGLDDLAFVWFGSYRFAAVRK